MAAVTDDTRQVEIWESSNDLNDLYRYGFQLQFAKSVIGWDGRLDFSIVWQSKDLAPRTSISWAPIYALNWARELPRNGMWVTASGQWQECAPGQSYDLNRSGRWDKSPSASPKPDFMNIGRIDYQSPSLNGTIYILIGVKNPSGGFDIIYIDRNPLRQNMSASYQPQEEVKWWLEIGNHTATMISMPNGPTETYNLSVPDPNTQRYYVSSTYLYQAGKWKTSPYPPSGIMESGVLGSAQSEHKSGSHLEGEFKTGNESCEQANSGN